VGGECATATVRAQSLSLLDSGESLLLRISPTGEPSGGEGTLTVVNPCLSGGTLEIFLEPVNPSPTIAVFGDSPIAAALESLAGHVGFRIGQLPGTPGGELEGSPVAVVVASHGRDEEPVLEAAVKAGVPYVGLVASRKRGEAVVASLDLDDAERSRVHTPAGLDIGARTPREVALSILAEVVSLRPRPSGRPPPAAGSSSPEASVAGDWRTSTGTSRAGGAGETREADETETAGETGVGGAGGRPEVAQDPVCGMAVVADDTALHLDHGGVRYWFCGSGCLRAFAADPSSYLPGP
jgi:xanthine dehydrogenase accessory factor